MTKALQPDDLITHYCVIRVLGAGGMGGVYLARDSTLDGDIALKVLPQMGQDDERVRRFVLEAKSASSLNRPHIITVYEIGRNAISPKGTTVLSHRFIRGQEATAFTGYGADLIGHIYRVNVDGNDTKQLTKGTGETLVAVTPDGKKILYITPQATRTGSCCRQATARARRSRSRPISSIRCSSRLTAN
ncbi:MAG TPA: hypothetical protein VEL51_21405 [Vicinamibacterales bacterium]|nr:hypothetical protein [Vicinamibacterales bacterium]